MSANEGRRPTDDVKLLEKRSVTECEALKHALESFANDALFDGGKFLWHDRTLRQSLDHKLWPFGYVNEFASISTPVVTPISYGVTHNSLGTHP